MSESIHTDHPHLKSELHNAGPYWFYLYECGHLTDQIYPVIDSAVPIGNHANLLLCRHCWQHIKGMAIEEMTKELIRHEPAMAAKLKEIADGHAGSG